MILNNNYLYESIFKDYPDVLTVKQVSGMLNICTKTVYHILNNGELESLKIGSAFRIPKINVLKYMQVVHSTLEESETSNTL